MTNDPIYIGTEDGLAMYAKPENIDGVDRAMQRDHMRRAAHDKAAKALYEFYQKQKLETEQ
jgi:hypothetical protein